MEKLKKTQEAWSHYYQAKKHKQKYPDENLVRILQDIPRGPALDLGCGRGRHLALLKDLGFSPIYAADTSTEALQESSQNFPFAQALELKLPSENDSSKKSLSSFLPLADSSLQLVLAWGVLHYNPPHILESILCEIQRLLRPGAFFAGTLRADSDTHLKTNKDLKGSAWQLYNEQECRKLLEKHFNTLKLGYMERSPLNALEQRICHWFFYCSELDSPQGYVMSHSEACGTEFF